MNRYSERLQRVREDVRGNGLQWDISNLPFTDEEKEIILEYLASRFWRVLWDAKLEDGGFKIYDPLKIEGDVALSYAFDFEDGGRRHAFRDLPHLEQMLINEMVGYINNKAVEIETGGTGAPEDEEDSGAPD